MATESTVLVICGGGNGAHTWSAIASSQPNTEVRVLTLNRDRAQRWSDSLAKEDFTVSFYRDEKVYSQLKSKPKLVTSNPEEAIPGCDVIAFVLPAFLHAQYLKTIKPYIEPGMILIGLPGKSGFEFQVRDILGDVILKHCAVVSLDTLPWATRIIEFGKSSEVHGVKESLIGAIRTGATPPKKDPQAVLQRLLGEKPVLDIRGHLIGITLMCNAFVHPCVIQDRWENWDGRPVDKQPLFFQGISEQGANYFSRVSDEMLAVAKEITKQSRNTDMSQVGHSLDWFKRCYPYDIEDKSTLFKAITTNRVYKGRPHPMVQTHDGKWVPNFKHRYIVEDMPFGIIVVRGIAEVVGVETPHIDKLIEWTQNIMKKSYLVDGKLKGEDVKDTRAPQRYGFTTLKDLL